MTNEIEYKMSALLSKKYTATATTATPQTSPKKNMPQSHAFDQRITISRLLGALVVAIYNLRTRFIMFSQIWREW